MFVLMDIEWIENRYHYISPTQIAAVRVDEQWNCLERFYFRIAPRDHSFHIWKHMAYTGGTPSDFLYANGLHRVLTNLQSWLREDDVICFWYEDSKNILKSIYNLIFKSKVPQRILVLGDYVFPFLSEHKRKIGNAYQICREYGAQATAPKHHSENDVAAMQKALGCIRFPAVLLYGKPPKPQTAQEASVPIETLNIPDIPDAMQPYQLDLNTRIFHKTGCSELAEDAALTGYPNLTYFFRKKLTPCPYCMKEDMRKAIRARNQDIIARTQYQFVYAENSEVFHRRGCAAILNTTSVIKGSGYYDTCAATGRRPCKRCNPTAGIWPNMAAKKKAKRIARQTANASTSVPDRSMNAQEKRAYERYTEARTERFTAAKKNFRSETEKNDFYTLTQPRFAFFCGAGYQTFHRRSCQKLHGLSNIIGFSKYKDAIRSGHTPCKFCKPTAKLDIECSIPITNQKRKGESINDLKTLCTEQGYSYEISDQYFSFATTVGRWKIDFSSTPYLLYHINRVRTPNNEYHYHRQPRLFLSLLDLFEYIQRHDKKLMEHSENATVEERNMATE